MDLQCAVNAPLEVTIKGKEYKISEYTLYDFAVFRRRIQSHKIKLANLIEDKVIQQATIDRILDTEISDEEVNTSMGSIEGITFLLWCMLKPNQDIELKDVEPMVDSDNFTEILSWITKLSPYKLKKKAEKKKK